MAYLSSSLWMRVLAIVGTKSQPNGARVSCMLVVVFEGVSTLKMKSLIFDGGRMSDQ